MTETSPAFPAPAVRLPIPEKVPDPWSTVTGPEVMTETSPAFPAAPATVPRNAPESTVSGPSTLTSNVPPTPTLKLCARMSRRSEDQAVPR
jgi:hypothetical protein